MNNKEFIESLSQAAGLSLEDTRKTTNAFCDALVEVLDDETALGIKGFGTFEVKKRLERVAVNPSTQQKVLVPPKLIVKFRPSQSLKDSITGEQ